MHSAVQLNEHLKRESGNSSLVMVNLPAPPKKDLTQSSLSCKLLIKSFTFQIVFLFEFCLSASLILFCFNFRLALY